MGLMGAQGLGVGMGTLGPTGDQHPNLTLTLRRPPLPLLSARGVCGRVWGVPRVQWDLGEVPELESPTSNEPLLLQALERGPFDDEAPQLALHPFLL